MNPENIHELEKIAAELRSDIITYSSQTRTPHLGSCLSCVDILCTLYFSVMNIDPKNPDAQERDRFILSKGHAAPALFQVLAKKGFYDPNLLWSENVAEGEYFGEHPPSPDRLSGIEAATGALGHGFPMGLGMALSAKLHKIPYQVYAVLGDGECNEGSIWEAAMLASAKELDNLTVIVDFNKWQATGRSKEVMGLDPLKKKWDAFGWHSIEVDGNSIPDLLNVFNELKALKNKPQAIIAHTIKGKGVSFMEDDNNWHYRIPNEEEVMLSKKELGLI